MGLGFRVYGCTSWKGEGLGFRVAHLGGECFLYADLCGSPTCESNRCRGFLRGVVGCYGVCGGLQSFCRGS